MILPIRILENNFNNFFIEVKSLALKLKIRIAGSMRVNCI